MTRDGSTLTPARARYANAKTAVVQSREHAERNAAAHRGTRPAPFSARGLGIVR